MDDPLGNMSADSNIKSYNDPTLTRWLDKTNHVFCLFKLIPEDGTLLGTVNASQSPQTISYLVLPYAAVSLFKGGLPRPA